MLKSLLLFLLVSFTTQIQAQSKFSGEFNFGINFYSASREDIVFDRDVEESVKGQYQFTTQTYIGNSLQNNDRQIQQFIEIANVKMLNKKLTCYTLNSNGEPSSLEPVEPEYYFYKHDTEFVENEKGELFPIPISDTTNFSKMQRIDCIQEWFFNRKKNKFEVQTIAFTPVFPRYNYDNKFKGWKKSYTRLQEDFSSVNNQKKITKNSNTIWAQRIYLPIPVKDFKLDYNSYKKTQPIKSIMNPELSEILFQQILDHQLKAYIPNTQTVYTPPRLDSLMTSRKDTEYIESEYGDLEVIAIIEPYTVKELSRINVKQTITFNPKTSRIEAKIESITLNIMILNQYDQFIRNEELFEIRFDD